MGKLAEGVGGRDHVQELLGPLELLSSMEEASIREKAVESIRFCFQHVVTGGGGSHSSIRAAGFPFLPHTGS
jgi:hypothetical protein